MPQDWFAQNAPKAAPAGDDWFAANAPKDLYDPSRKPVSAEDFAPVKTSPIREKAKGVLKGAVSSLAGLGELAVNAGLIPGVQPAAFNADLRHPAFTQIEDATTARNPDQRIGKYAETAAEVAVPAFEAGKAGLALAKAAPAAIAKSAPVLGKVGTVAADLATEALPFGRVARKILGHVLDMGAKEAPAATNAGGKLVTAATKSNAEAELAKVLEELRAPQLPESVELPPPAELPPGYTPRTSAPEPVAPVNAGGRLVPPQIPRTEQAIADALTEAAAPVKPTLVTTPPAAELPPGYTPRTTVPKPKAAPKAAPVAETAAPSNAKPYVKSVTHITTPEGAKGILSEGFDFKKGGGIGGDSYGPGIYASDTSRDLGSFWRSQLETRNESGLVDATALKGKANLQKALVIDDMKPMGGGRYAPRTPEEIVSKHMPDKMGDFQMAVKSGMSKNAALGEVARKSGYDGMVFERSAGDEVIAFKPEGVAWEGAAAKTAAEPPTPRAYFLKPAEQIAEEAATAPAPTSGTRPYFLRSEADMAELADAAKSAKTKVKASGSITMDDLPEAWKSRTGQDLFPLTGEEGKALAAELADEMKTRGMSPGQAMAIVSKNKSISVQMRTQLLRALNKSGG